MTIKTRRAFPCWTLLGAMTGCLLAGQASAAEIEGFTEPYRDLDVAAADVGIVSHIHIKEGDHVTKSQILGQLDQSLLEATLQIADRNRSAKGRINSAEADTRLRKERVDKLKILLDRKHASQEEVDRSFVESEVSVAQLLAVQEEIQIRGLEYDRIQIQIEQRNVRSPIDGVVTKVHRDVGEFVSGSEPVIATVVQLDPLIATYSVPSVFSKEIKPDAPVNMLIGDGRTSAQGTVEYIAPVTDAQSGTIQVKVRLPNPNNLYRSGEKCLLVVKGELPKTETASQHKPTSTSPGAAPRVSPVAPAPPAKPTTKTTQLDVGTAQ